MFQLILGRSGSGKSKYAFSLAVKLPRDKVMFLVPEQFTLQTERRLLDEYGCNALPRSVVTSFSGLARDYHAVYEPAGRYIDDFGRHILMERAIREEKDALRLYGGRVSRSLTQAFLSLSSEMKTACLTPEELLTLSEKQTGNALSDKLYDIGLVSAHYDALVKEKYIDAGDDLTKLANGITENRLYRGMNVFVDGFHNFSAQEMRVIEALMTQAERVVVTMPCPDLLGEEKDALLFENVREDARKLVGMANKLGIPREKTILLKENHRAQTNALKEWETSVIGTVTPSDDCNGIELYSASGTREEADLLAALISHDVKEGKCRYCDCAVIARSVTDYEAILQNAFERANVPFYMDSRADIRQKPLFTLMQTALETAAGRRDGESLFRCLKTGFFPAKKEDIYRLENYCLLWELRGKELFEEYKGHPRGFDENWTDRDKWVLEDRNRTRENVMPPLERLCFALSGSFTGETFSRALYDFLTDLRVPEQIDRRCDELRKTKGDIAADEELRVWEQAVTVLDQITFAAGDVTMNAREAVDLFDVACSNADMGRIPPTADAVTIGSADRIRVPDVKNVYIFACNDGDFPRLHKSGGILSDRDRRELNDKGLRIGGDAVYWSAEEMFIAYKAFAAPSEKLTVLFHRADRLGGKTEPSVFVGHLIKKFPSLREKAAEELPLAWLTPTPAAALSLLARRSKTEAPSLRSLKAALMENETVAPVLKSMEQAADNTPAAIRDPDYATGLFDRDMRISASKLETFRGCPYQYFLHYGLALSPMEKFGLKKNTLGTIAHDILEHAIHELCDRGPDTVTEADVKECVGRFAEEFYNNRMAVGRSISPSTRYQFERTKKTVTTIAGHIMEELRQSEYKPVAYELGVGKDRPVPPYALSCKEGSICMEGKIDRVDKTKGDNAYFRVVDYKTGTKVFSLSNLTEGKDMQMLLYLFALKENGADFAFDTPGGVLYCPVKRDDITDNGSEKDNETEKRKKKQMNGLFLDDWTCLRGMERDLAGQYIPIVEKNGNLTGETLATPEEFSVLKDYIDLSLINMHDELNAGHIAPNPSELKRKQCDYCRYKAACAAAPEALADGKETKMKDEEAMEQIRRSVEEAKNRKEGQDCVG